MINIVAILEIADAEAFEEFESKAIAIMRCHKGVLVSAFETQTPELSSGVTKEIHCIQFPNRDDFDRYRADPELAQLADLRSKAIASTEVYISSKEKTY